MLYREIIAVCSEIHTKDINTAVWAESKIFNVEYGGTYSDHCAVHIVTIMLQTVNEIFHVTSVVHKAVRDTAVCEKLVHFYETTRRQPPEGSAAPRCPTSHLA